MDIDNIKYATKIHDNDIDKVVDDEFKNEKSMKLNSIHEKLRSVKFFSRYRIKEYFHNTTINYLRDSSFNDNYNGFMLMGGRMGNGDDVVYMRERNNHIVLLTNAYGSDTNAYGSGTKTYLGKISKALLGLEGDDFKTACDAFLLEREIMFNNYIQTKKKLKQSALSKISHLSDEEKRSIGITI